MPVGLPKFANNLENLSYMTLNTSYSEKIFSFITLRTSLILLRRLMIRFFSLFVLLVVASCGTKSEVDSIGSKSSQEQIQQEVAKTEPVKNPELEKLAKRRKRWLSADRCLQGVSALSEKVGELCAQNQDIFQLSEGAGYDIARTVVDYHLKILDTYEKNLTSGIIDVLPEDVSMGEGLGARFATARYDEINFELDIKASENKTCIYQSATEGTSPDSCIAKNEQKYAEKEREINAFYDKAEQSLNLFISSYRKDP